MSSPDVFTDLGQQEARLERALTAFRSDDRARIRGALAFARRAHAGQVRKGTGDVPYIVHPIRVAASLVAEFDVRDGDAVVAALLHDVVEDCGVTIPAIRAEFGSRVAAIVRALTFTRDDAAKWRQAAALRHADVLVRTIKAADITDNVRDYARTPSAQRGAVLRSLYGYTRWGRALIAPLSVDALARFEQALREAIATHFGSEDTPSFPLNPGKALVIQIPDSRFQMLRAARYPIRTHVVTAQDNLAALIRRYAVPHLRPGDLLAVSERIVAITQGRAFPIAEIHPSRLARFLVRFVTRSPYGIGLGSPQTMELAIREAGLPRILLAACVAAITKPFGIRGVFYRVVGRHINAIDGPCDYTIPIAFSPLPAGRGSERGRVERYAKLGPKDPEGVATNLARAIGVDVAIVDANDLGVNVLGASEGVDRTFVRATLKDNPLGQSNEQTPLAIVRAANNSENPKP